MSRIFAIWADTEPAVPHDAATSRIVYAALAVFWALAAAAMVRACA